MPILTIQNRFEAQIQAVKERLEAAKISARGLPSSPGGIGATIFSGAASRIAKPLRGGGGTDGGVSAPIVNGGPSIPILSSLQYQDSANSGGGGGGGGGGKQTNWFFQNR